MKTVLIIILSAVCVAVSYAAATEDDLSVGIETRGGLSLGNIAADDRLLSNTNHAVEAALYVVQEEEVLIRTVSYSKITSIHVMEVGAPMNASVNIIEGGLRANFVKLLFKSQKGRAYSYNIRIHGTIEC